MNNLKIYPEFTANQTLSHENLNDLFKYLDAEQRQTRQQLIGTGILCGFNLHPMGANTYLSPGIAISTEGYILAMEKQFDFKFYRKFADKGAGYLPLKDKVFEVLDKVPEDEKESNLLKFSALDAEYREGVVVVYLEDQLKDIESCEGESCDNKGKEHRLSLKVLIISKSQAAMYVDNNADYYANLDDDTERHPAYNIGRLKIRRPLITKDIVEMSQLRSLFESCISKAERDLFEYFNSLRKVFPKEFSGLQIFSSDIALALNSLKTEYSHFQQVYDWFETLFRAVNEWVDFVQSSHLSCIKRSRHFKRHVFAGSMTKQEFPPQLFRHYFEAVQQDSMSLNSFEVLKILSTRIKLIIDKTAVNKLDQIAILPEKRSTGKLEDRAIPYFLSYNSLKKYWSPSSDLVKRLDFDNFGINRQKLSCSFEDKDFFRIDGHVGLSRQDALTSLQKLREDYNLEFDIKALYVDEPQDLKKSDCCSYESLRLMYQIASQGLKMNLLESFYSLESLKKFRKENEYRATPKLEAYIKKGYSPIDFRHFDLFSSKTVELSAEKTAKAYEGVRILMKENPDAVNPEVKKAYELNEEISKAEGDKSSEEFKSNDRIILKFAEEKGMAIKSFEQPAMMSLYDEKEYTDYVKEMPYISVAAEEKEVERKASVSKEMEVRIDKLINNTDIKNNPELRDRIKEFVEIAVKETPGKPNSELIDLKVIPDGMHTLLVSDLEKKVIFVEANPHQAEYGTELALEKTLPSIMLDLFDFQLKVPGSLETLNYEVLNELNKLLSRKINLAYKFMETVHESYKCHINIKRIFSILNKININIWLAQFKMIVQLFKERERNIEENSILSKIVKYNPGLEHRAGVPIGGTFFLLTQKGAKPSKETSKEFSKETFRRLLLKSDSKEAEAALRVIDDKKFDSREELIELLGEKRLYGIIGEESAERSREIEKDFRDDNFGDDLVIGDFCLNGTVECCDIRYIVHTDIRLNAPKKIFCDDQKIVNLDVHPRGGSIFGPGTSQEEHNYMFNPSHPDVKIGENILTYAIADQKVDLVVEVIEHPVAEIKVISKVIDNGFAIIEAESAFGGTEYEWSYDDKKPEAGSRNHTFKIPAESSEIEVTLKLKVSNKVCSASDEEKVKLSDVQLILPGKIFCSTDKAVTLSGSPAGGKFSGNGVKADKFDPFKVTFKDKENIQSVDITYTLDGDSESKSVIVIKHPKAQINVLEQRLDGSYAVLRLQNGTKPLEGYEYLWSINGELIPEKEEIHNEFKYVDGKVVVKLTAWHPELKTCQDTALLTFEQPLVDEPTVEDDVPKTDKTFEFLKESNAKNIKFLNQLKDDLNSLEFNPDILTGEELNSTRSLLSFIEQSSQNNLLERGPKQILQEMEELVVKFKKALDAGVGGPEITLYGIRLVSALNLSSVLDSKLSLLTPLKSILTSINKIKSTSPGIKYGLQSLIPAELWLNKDNQAQAEKFWNSIQA